MIRLKIVVCLALSMGWVCAEDAPPASKPAETKKTETPPPAKSPKGKSKDDKAGEKETPPAEAPVKKDLAAADTANMNEREYIMYKAVHGTRPERLEALDVIERTVDAEMVPFLLERLRKEDDRFLTIKVMHALALSEDVRAIPPLREIAKKDLSRVGVEAVIDLYDLGDDNYVPILIKMLRMYEDYPELTYHGYRGLKQIYGITLQASARAWNNYYHSHRLAPYQKQSWYATFRPPLPPTVTGTTKVSEEARTRTSLRLPQEDVRVRHQIISFFDFWRQDD